MSGMRRGLPLIVMFLVLAAHAGERRYRSGVLKRVDIEDVVASLPLQTRPGQSIALPIPLGLDYQFQIQCDMIVYVGMCKSKDKRNYGADWVVNDPIEFRVDRDKLFLKRSPKGELRLARLTRLRVMPNKNDAAGKQSSVEVLSSLATSQTVPECH
jgi:hypothetical protein